MKDQSFMLSRLVEEFEHHVFELGFERIDTCLSMLTEEQLIFKPNPSSNSVANLVIHLCGNLRQWIMTSFGEKDDIRNRNAEFQLDHRELGKAGLLELVQKTNEETKKIVDSLDESQVRRKYTVQNYHVDGVYILCHVMEHYSYHVGQITYITKMLTDKSTNYYDDSLL